MFFVSEWNSSTWFTTAPRSEKCDLKPRRAWNFRKDIIRRESATEQLDFLRPSDTNLCFRLKKSSLLELEVASVKSEQLIVPTWFPAYLVPSVWCSIRLFLFSVAEVFFGQAVWPNSLTKIWSHSRQALSIIYHSIIVMRSETLYNKIRTRSGQPKWYQKSQKTLHWFDKFIMICRCCEMWYKHTKDCSSFIDRDTEEFIVILFCNGCFIVVQLL